MPILEIITIGTELLLGEITDTNSTYLARTLRDHGIDIYRITTIGDNPGRITLTIQEALQRADIIITTGGLGPTIDDPTRQAVADAAHRKLVFKPELWEQILERFKNYGSEPTENNRRQAYIPEGSIPVKNPVGTAPCFIIEIGNACIVSLPGVPQEMEFVLHQSILPYLSNKYDLKSQIIKATILHTASLGESVIDEMLQDLEQHSNPTVGLLAHPGQVDIRITAKALSENEAIELSQPIIKEIKGRLGDHIYGQDEETLESIIGQLLNDHNLRLYLLEFGLDGQLIERVKLGHPTHMFTQKISMNVSDEEDFCAQINALDPKDPYDICFGTALVLNKQVTVHFYYKDSLYWLAALKDHARRPSHPFLVTYSLLNTLTKLYRYVVKKPDYKGQGGGLLSGTLYAPSLVRALSATSSYKRSVSRLSRIFKNTSRFSYDYCLATGDAAQTGIQSNSIDYLFIDPPFGSNLYYSELSHFWESWLSILSSVQKEAVENSAHGKGANEYRVLMTQAFKEAYRVLRPGRWMTVEFSNTKASVWNSIQTALTEAGFIVANVSARKRPMSC